MPNAIKALGDCSDCVSYLPAGNFLEKKNNAAAIINKAPTQA